MLEISILSVFAASGNVYIFTYTWDGYNTRAAGNYDVFKHIWAMGYSGTEYLNNGASPAFSVLPKSSIWIGVSDGANGMIKMGSKNSVSYIYGGSYYSGNDRAIGNLPANYLSNTKLVVYLSPYSAVPSALGDLCKQTYQKGAKCVFGWKGKLQSDWSTLWVKEFFRTANEDKEDVFKCMFNGEREVLIQFGGTAYDYIQDTEVYGDIDQFLYK